MNNLFSKKTLCLITVIACLLIITIPTVYKVIKDHQTKLYAVLEKAIVEASEKCWNKGDCKNETITLKELYDLKYLEKQINPVTKKVYDQASTITKRNKKIELNLK